MTLTFDLGSRNIDKDMTHIILHQIPKFHKDSPKRLGGVREHTHRHTQTDRGVTSINNIDHHLSQSATSSMGCRFDHVSSDAS